MRFEDALKLMREGKKITRPGWVIEQYIFWKKDRILYGSGSSQFHETNDDLPGWLIADDFVEWKDPSLRFKDLKNGEKFKVDKLNHANIYMKLISTLYPNSCVTIEPPGYLYHDQNPDMVVYRAENDSK